LTAASFIYNKLIGTYSALGWRALIRVFLFYLNFFNDRDLVSNPRVFSRVCTLYEVLAPIVDKEKKLRKLYLRTTVKFAKGAMSRYGRDIIIMATRTIINNIIINRLRGTQYDAPYKTEPIIINIIIAR